jgi:acyl carrier protein
VSAQTATATQAALADDVQRRVKEFISTNFYVTDPLLLEPDAPLVENGVVDSTGILEVISFLETEFAVRIADDEMLPENLGTIARIAAFVARKRGV